MSITEPFRSHSSSTVLDAQSPRAWRLPRRPGPVVATELPHPGKTAGAQGVLAWIAHQHNPIHPAYSATAEWENKLSSGWPPTTPQHPASSNTSVAKIAAIYNQDSQYWLQCHSQQQSCIFIFIYCLKTLHIIPTSGRKNISVFNLKSGSNKESILSCSSPKRHTIHFAAVCSLPFCQFNRRLNCLQPLKPTWLLWLPALQNITTRFFFFFKKVL